MAQPGTQSGFAVIYTVSVYIVLFLCFFFNTYNN